MVSVLSIMLVLAQVVVFDLVVCTRTLVASVNNGNIFMDMFVTITRKKRSKEEEDFTMINRYVCPPSLCRSYDEKTKAYKPRPRGTAGTIFYQGDIILDKKMGDLVFKDEDEDNEAGRGKRRTKRATMRPRKRMWKHGIVKYKFGKDITSRARKAFNDAREHIENRTCIRFQEKAKGEEDYIRFISEPGCWSQIGKVGGVQLVSLGSGCESLGTGVHEIVHALGVWHEQARPDRNRNVRILDRNISPKFKPDFEVVDKFISSTRGYPYDYNSLMHYSSHAFTRNGKPTIEVIGQGKELGLRIGKREGLSTIDIGQLRDMYKCNHKTNVQQSYCGKGWKKRDLSCYQFFTKTKLQFGSAVTACRGIKAHLLAINNKPEQRFMDKYLIKKFPDVLSWRMAGRRVNQRMVWYTGPGKYENMTYTNWAKDNPKSQSSSILKREEKDKRFKWFGEWLGSYSQRPQYEHAYICEKAARRKCYPGKYADGRDYRGTMDFTRDGYTCQKWTENYPRNHTLREAARDAATSKSKTDKDGLGDHNYCRNPSGLRRNRPWCYTAKKNHEWGYCDVSACVKTVERFNRRQKRRNRQNKEEEAKEARELAPSGYTSSASKRQKEMNTKSSSSTSSLSKSRKDKTKRRERRRRNRLNRIRQSS